MVGGISGVGGGVGVGSMGGGASIGGAVGAPPSAPSASPSAIVTLGTNPSPSLSNVSGAQAYQSVGEATGSANSVSSTPSMTIEKGPSSNSFKITFGGNEMNLDFSQTDPLKGLDDAVAALLLALLLKHLSQK